MASLEEVLSRPMAEAFRQCAHLTEAGLHQRLETSKVKRELGLQTEKVRYQERVIAELEARLEEYEAEAFRSQSALEAERMDLLGKIRGLEEQLLSLGSKAAEEDGGVHGAREAGLRASAADIHHAQRRRAERFQFLGRAVEDRETMLDQVERERGLRQELAEAQAELKAAKQALTDAEYTHGLLKVRTSMSQPKCLGP